MPLNAAEIKNGLKNEYKGIDLLVLKSTDSTNNEAKRLISGGKRGVFAVISDSQTAGRGRNGHSFYSPEETGIYMSVATSPDLPVEKALKSTAAAAVAVCASIEKLTGKKPGIKWVNDIFISGKKVCGILAEAVADGRTGNNPLIVTGIGINVSTVDFPDEINEIAGSLGAKETDRNILIAEIINRFLDFSADLESEEITDGYRSRSIVTGKYISFEQNGVSFTAKAVEIGADCSLTVELPDGKRKTLRSGEISIKPL